MSCVQSLTMQQVVWLGFRAFAALMLNTLAGPHSQGTNWVVAVLNTSVSLHVGNLGGSCTPHQ